MEPPQDAPNLSVVLITLNEEARLAACLRSLPRGAEIVVLDSGSTDRTVEIAAAHGARVATRPFTNYSEQKNAAVAKATRPWVFSIDADEVVTPVLARALGRVTTDAGTPEAGFMVRRSLVFMGRRLRFGRASDRPVRVFRRGQGSFEADIHERVVVGGRLGRLEGVLLHHSYDDLSDYFRRFNAYTSRVAESHDRQGHAMPPLAVHVLRPWVEFVSRYVFRLGFLDGYPGYTYALLSALYAYVKYAKLKERRGGI